MTITVTVSKEDDEKVRLQAIVTAEDCRPDHTIGEQDEVEINFEGDED